MNKDYLKIKEDLIKLGIKAGDKVIMHSSYKSLGEVEGGAMTLINALKDVITEDGILMLPTFTYDYVNAKNPIFDVRYTASNTGYITEVFRKSEGVLRSVHPTHSFAVWGNDKEYYVKDHYKDQVCVAENSPIYKLMENGGKILMLGISTSNNTLIHGVEVVVKPPYFLAVDYSDPKYHREYSCIDYNNNIVRQEFFHGFPDVMGWHGNFTKLNEICEMQTGEIHGAFSYLMDAKTVWDVAMKKMKEEPYFFVRPM